MNPMKSIQHGARQAGGSFAILILLILLISFIEPRFLNRVNLINVLRIASITVLAVYGQTLVLLTGEIDLSMGSVAGMVSVMVGISLNWFGLPLVPSFIIGLASGTLLGLLNGILVFHVKLPSFIITF